MNEPPSKPDENAANYDTGQKLHETDTMEDYPDLLIASRRSARAVDMETFEHLDLQEAEC